MKSEIILHGGMPGRFNMEFDLTLTRHIKPGHSIFRLYRWNPYCISLGIHQSENEISRKAIDWKGYDIVRRPTGGRAVFHSGELTYSFVTLLNEYDSPLQWYRDINSFLLDGLNNYSSSLQDAVLEETQPSFRSVYAEKNGAACFATAAKNEVKVEGKKLIGSAQRKMGRVLLQHGSILCTPEHERISSLLHLTEQEKFLMDTELKSSTTTIETVTGEPIKYRELADCLIYSYQQFISQYQPMAFL